MSGILPGIPLINNFDSNGTIMAGALLRLYQAGTVTPVTAYKDPGLTAGLAQPWPLVADSAGRIPMFWLADGSYRARLSSANGGYVAYDIPIMSTVGSSGGSSGGSGVSPEVIFQTGHILQRIGSGVLGGYVRLNGRTLGNAVSGATERANADTVDLYEYLYTECDDTICPVTGGRGASAAADYAAGKPLGLIDARSRVFIGADDMGNTAAGRLTTASFATPTTVGSSGGGTETVTLITGNLPPYTPAGGVATSTASTLEAGTSTGTAAAPGGGGTVAVPTSPTPISGASWASPFTGTAQGGTSTPFITVSPGIIVTHYVKL